MIMIELALTNGPSGNKGYLPIPIEEEEEEVELCKRNHILEGIKMRELKCPS